MFWRTCSSDLRESVRLIRNYVVCRRSKDLGGHTTAISDTNASRCWKNGDLAGGREFVGRLVMVVRGRRWKVLGRWVELRESYSVDVKNL